MKPKVCEIFSGVGGMSLGAAQAGGDLRLAVEIDDRALEAHRINFPRSKHLQQDVASISGKRLLEAAGLAMGELDGLIGGPPCQGFSTIGRRAAGDERNSLFAHFFRLVHETKPAFFVAENVTGIMSEEHESLRKAAIRRVSNDYTVLPPITIRASDFGAPTSRTRVFFIGYLEGRFERKIVAEDFEFGVATEVKVREALRGLPAKIVDDWTKNPLGRHRLHDVQMTPFLESLLNSRPSGVGNDAAYRALSEKSIVVGHIATKHSKALRQRYENLRPGEQDKATKSVRLRADGFCPTLRAGTDSTRGSFQAVRPIHYRYGRVITPREAARLQSFPDWFLFDKTKWHSFRQIGNSVPPTLAREVISRILKKY